MIWLWKTSKIETGLEVEVAGGRKGRIRLSLLDGCVTK